MSGVVQGGRRGSGVKLAAIPRCLPAPVCRALALEIKERREARHLSKYAFAKRAGISRQMVDNIENKGAIPTVDMVARIGFVFGLPPSGLLSKAERRG